MNNPREIGPSKPARITINSMITQDLGYCCEAAFFYLHRKNFVIAARLGVTPASVAHHRREAGDISCGDSCIIELLAERGRLRK